MKEFILYLDDSGQFHKNYNHSDYFVYGGFLTSSTSLPKIIDKFDFFMKNNFSKYREGLEVKASEMKDSKKRKLYNFLGKNCCRNFTPVFFVVDVAKMTTNFDDKSAVMLQKNYTMKMLVNNVIRKIQEYSSDIEGNKLSIYIDNQSQVNVRNRDKLEIYIKKCFSSQKNYLSDTKTAVSNLEISVKFKESHDSKPMQLADILANSKMTRYSRDNKVLNTLFQYYEEEALSIYPICQKFPRNFGK